MTAQKLLNAPVEKISCYGPIVLYCEDIEEMRDVLNAKEATFFLGGHMSLDLSALEEKYQGRRLYEMRVYCQEHNISLKMNRQRSALIFNDSGDSSNIGVYHRVDSILKEAERRPRFIYNRILCLLSPVMVIMCLLFWAKFRTSMDGLSSTALLLCFALSLSLLWGLYVNIFQRTVISLTSKYREIGFMLKNKDTLIINTIIAVATALLTLILERAFDATPP